MRPLYRAGQRDTCTVRSQPVCTALQYCARKPLYNELRMIY